jgi:hypothetical protein
VKIFILVLGVAAVVGGFVGGELMDETFSLTGAVVGGIGAGGVLLGLGAYFHAQEEQKRKASAVTPEMRAVFDRLLGGQNPVAPAPGIDRRALTQADPVKVTLDALTEVEAEDLPAFSLMKSELVRLIRNREKTTLSIVEDRLPPKGLVFLLISNITFRELSSGRHHVYRGVLSMSGTELKRAFDLAVRRMVVLRVHDEADCHTELVKVREAIKGAG